MADTRRYDELDVLRGLSILLMVLSGSIAFGGVLPGWMYHAQVPPPAHRFDPALPGITWVDLVFPFFLFSMGAAMPLALGRRLQQQTPLQVWTYLLRRFVLLAWLAFYFNHTKPWVLHPQYTPAGQWFISIGSFVVLFAIFYDWKMVRNQMLRQTLPWLAVCLSAGQLWLLHYADGKPFHLGRVDIIILVLANMALFGGTLWLFTRHKPWWRAVALVFVMGIFLSRDVEGSWQRWLFQLTPDDQVYRFYFLKYLFIVVPGMLAGEWLVATQPIPNASLTATQRGSIILVPIALLLLNLYGLYTRHLLLNLGGTMLLSAVLLWQIRQLPATSSLRRMAEAGVILLLLGLSWEAYEGGIKKDSSTYSYYAVCSGLAMLLLPALQLMLQYPRISQWLQPVCLNGRNPLVAYVAGALLVTPLMGLIHLLPYWNGLNANAWQGLLKGLLYTAAVGGITVLFSKKGWYWRS